MCRGMWRRSAGALAPYGGAMIQRRTVLDSTTAGLGEAGTQAFGGALEAGAGNYIALTQVSGHVLDWDDYTVVTGTTYDYRVIPVSQRGVPNNVGAREGPDHGDRTHHARLFSGDALEPAPQREEPA